MHEFLRTFSKDGKAKSTELSKSQERQEALFPEITKNERRKFQTQEKKLWSQLQIFFGENCTEEKLLSIFLSKPSKYPILAKGFNDQKTLCSVEKGLNALEKSLTHSRILSDFLV